MGDLKVTLQSGEVKHIIQPNTGNKVEQNEQIESDKINFSFLHTNINWIQHNQQMMEQEISSLEDCSTFELSTSAPKIEVEKSEIDTKNNIIFKKELLSSDIKEEKHVLENTFINGNHIIQCVPVINKVFKVKDEVLSNSSWSEIKHDEKSMLINIQEDNSSSNNDNSKFKLSAAALKLEFRNKSEIDNKICIVSKVDQFSSVIKEEDKYIKGESCSNGSCVIKCDPLIKEVFKDVFSKNDVIYCEELNIIDTFEDSNTICEKTITNTTMPSEVVRNKSIKLLKFSCCYCDKMFSESKVLWQHLRKHAGKRPYECQYCSRCFRTEDLLKVHTRTHTEGRPHKCTLCSMQFIRKEHLQKHILAIHENNKFFKCLKCSKTFNAKSKLRRHIEAHEKNIKKIVSRDRESQCITGYSCNICDKVFHLNDSLTEHCMSHKKFSNVEITIDKYSYSNCRKMFKSKETLKKGCNLFTKGKFYTCKICGKKTLNKANHQKHEQLHRNIYPFTCAHCKKSFKCRVSLLTHINAVHSSIKAYSCSICCKTFTNKGNLMSHIEVHHTDDKAKKYFCETCNMGFLRLVYLKRHVKIHTGEEKKFICDLCGLKCRSKRDIELHVNTHIGGGDKPFCCEICNMAFAKRSHYIRHQLVHSNKKPYSCDMCGKAYKDTSSLSTHNKSVHLNITYTCEACGFHSSNEHSFKRHLRKCDV